MILEGYGLSETSPVACFNHPHQSARRGRSARRSRASRCAWSTTEVTTSAGEVGEIIIRGHNVMNGYWNKPEATAEAIPDGWFHTGDMAKVDEDGFLYIVDRKKDLIIRGGYNVYPRRSRRCSTSIPASEAAVVGVPHDVSARRSAPPWSLAGHVRTPAELRAFVRERIAAYKYPRQVWLMDDLPKGPTGKILRREVHPPQQESAAARTGGRVRLSGCRRVCSTRASLRCSRRYSRSCAGVRG